MPASNSYDHAWIAGVALIVACICSSVFTAAVENSYSSYTQAALVIVTIAIYIGALIWHIRGYDEFVKENKVFLRSTQIMRALLALFGIAVVTALVVSAYFPTTDLTVANAFVGFVIILLIIPTLVFMFAMLRSYDKLGIFWSLVAAATVPAAVFFLGRPWPVALLVLASTFFFYRASTERISSVI